jgi:hypothetical protein
VTFCEFGWRFTSVQFDSGIISVQDVPGPIFKVGQPVILGELSHQRHDGGIAISGLKARKANHSKERRNRERKKQRKEETKGQTKPTTGMIGKTFKRINRERKKDKTNHDREEVMFQLILKAAPEPVQHRVGGDGVAGGQKLMSYKTIRVLGTGSKKVRQHFKTKRQYRKSILNELFRLMA